MNREIKFRGKRIDNGEWVVGELAYFFNNHKSPCIMPSCYFATRDFGEKDENGDPVIDDDIALGGFINVQSETVGQLNNTLTKKQGLIYIKAILFYTI
jgi:hypothetical protein